MANFRITGKMTRCEKCTDAEEQKKCGLYEKATFFERCKYLHFDEYCDWTENQKKETM